MTNSENIQELLKGLLLHVVEDDEFDLEVTDAGTFEENGVMTMDKGVVLTMEDGTEFQITINQSL